MSDLRVSALTATRGTARVLDRISLEVRRREIVAVIGRNGAGKTALLSSIAGLTPCSAAALKLDSRSLLGLAPETRSGRGLAYVPHVPNVFFGMTVRENLLLGGWATGNRDTERVVDILPPLGHVLDAPAGALGQLNRQLCAIGRALMTQAAMMLLDEPVRGMAPAESACLLGFLPDILSLGVSVLFTDHGPEGATMVADRLYVLDRGLMICGGPPTEMITDQRFLRVYSRGTDVVF
jgi:branched-chain amino acid transport system ATP-binding protein